MTPTSNTSEQHRLCPCKGCYVGTECQLKPHILRPNFREIAEDIFNRVTGPDMQRAEDTFKAGLVSRTPNEVDEHPWDTESFKILESTLRTQGVSKPTTEKFYESWRELEAYITKQQATYHAAGLRELPRTTLIDDIEDVETVAVFAHHIDQAIAREESKAGE